MKIARMMMVTLLVGFSVLGGNVLAEEESKGVFDLDNFSATFTITTDYVFRGVSQTDEEPAVQGSFDYAHPIGIYLGVWGSNVHSSVSEGSVELDGYIGYTRDLFTNFNFDVTALYYYYPGGGSDPEPDYWEGHLGLSYLFADLPLSPKLGGHYYYSPDFYGEDGTAHYFNGYLELSLPWEFSLAGELGYQTVEGDKLTGDDQGEDGGDGFDYYNWRVGLSRELLKFNLDLSYHDTFGDEDDFLGSNADGRLVFTISRTF
jgi:uncharacterized protein (TIGR02001 family)